MGETQQWDTISFVIRSDYRMLVLEQLATGPEPPSQIDTEETVLIEHVSHAIRELRERGLIELLVPESQSKPRPYGLTDRGEHIWQQIQAVDLV